MADKPFVSSLRKKTRDEDLPKGVVQRTKYDGSLTYMVKIPKDVYDKCDQPKAKKRRTYFTHSLDIAKQANAAPDLYVVKDDGDDEVNTGFEETEESPMTSSAASSQMPPSETSGCTDATPRGTESGPEERDGCEYSNIMF